MNRFVIWAGAIWSVLMVMVSCHPEVDKPVSGISLTESELILKTGQEHQLTAEIRPHNA